MNKMIKKFGLSLIIPMVVFGALCVLTLTGCDSNSSDDEVLTVPTSISGLWLLTPNTGSITVLNDDRWKTVADAALVRLMTAPLYSDIHIEPTPDYGTFMEEFIVSLDFADPIYTGSTKKEDEPALSQYYDFTFNLSIDTCDMKFNVYFNGALIYQISVLYDIALGRE